MIGNVLLLHGLGRTGGSMRTLAAAARREGLVTCAPSYAARRHTMEAIVADLRPRIAAFTSRTDDPVHIVTHSLGGLVARALIQAERPARLGRVVMLAPPNMGSELADLVYRMRLDRILLGPVGAHLRTTRLEEDEQLLGPIDYDLGIIAGNRALDPIFPRLIMSRPNDGKVTVAATRVPGMTDHIVLSVSHTLMVYDRRVVEQTMAFLRDGVFRH